MGKAKRISEEDVLYIIDSLLAQRLEHARTLLRESDLPRSGTREDLRKRFLEAIEDGDVEIADCIGLLDTVESWGRQHVFLYNGPSHVPNAYRSLQGVKEAVARTDWKIEVNTERPLALPKQRSVRAVIWTKDVIRVEFVEVREWQDRLKQLDYEEILEGQKVQFSASVERKQRAVCSFEWDLVGNTAQLFVHRLPSGNKYLDEQQSLHDSLSNFLPIDQFKKANIARAVTRLRDDADIVKERKTNYFSADGGKVSMQSSSRSTPVSADPALSEVKRAIVSSGEYGTSYLNCYWEARDGLISEIHTQLYSLESRVAFMGQYNEGVIRHVLSTVRSLSR